MSIAKKLMVAVFLVSGSMFGNGDKDIHKKFVAAFVEGIVEGLQEFWVDNGKELKPCLTSVTCFITGSACCCCGHPVKGAAACATSVIAGKTFFSRIDDKTITNQPK